MSDPSRFQRLARVTRRHRAYDPMASIPLVEGLSGKQRGRASQLLTAVAVPAGTLLAREGSRGDEFFVLLEGQVEVSRGGDAIAMRGPGSPLGEMALLEACPRSATLSAKTPGSTLVASKQEVASLLIAAPRVSERLRSIAAERQAA